MTSSEIRQKYFDFFTERGHALIPSASLRPENDPTTLFTGSGMQPLLPYLLGEKHPKGVRLVDSQKSFRAEDIEEVGDNRHTTFFEMLGNWSLGDYFKQEQLPWMFEFLTDMVGIDPERLYVTCFIGAPEYNIPQDTEAAELWQGLFKNKGVEADIAEIGSEEDGYKRGMRPNERIFYYDGKKNWWNRGKIGPDTTPVGDPCGPDSEMFYDFGTPHDIKFGKHCHPNCDCGRFMEIGNNVFMSYRKVAEGKFEPLPKPNVDFGGGLERITAASNDNPDVFAIDSFSEVITELEEGTEAFEGYTKAKKYSDPQYTPAFRVIADHVRGAVFMISDGVLPSNTDAGYVLRRLIRRAVRFSDVLELPAGMIMKAADLFIVHYQNIYPTLKENNDAILAVIGDEVDRFRKTLEKGMREFEKLSSKDVSGHDAFILFTTYGFPFELTKELAKEKNISVDRAGFEDEMKKHQEQSRAGAEQKFKGGLADAGEITTHLHTATHLMLAALRKYLGDHVHQAGSNITAERSRFDFTHPEKVDRETLDKVEQYVNDAIAAKAERVVEEMPKEEARATGVEGSFWEKYPDTVSVYVFKDKEGNVWSRELCGGPHVENTADIKGTFKITKEESSSAGVRRVRAVLE